MAHKQMTFKQWREEGTRRFGDDRLAWKFVCPVCGHVATWKDWEDVGAPEGAVAFACVGRWIDGSRIAFGDDDGPGPCNYTGGGLFRLNPLRITGPDGESTTFFDFAEVA